MDEIEKKYTLYDIIAPTSKFFDETGKPLYMNSSYYLKKDYDFISNLAKDKKNGRKCMMPNCDKKPIKNSHTIPEKAVLRKISDNTGHVLFPIYSMKDKKYTMKPIGVNLASTFSGFCNEHEATFSGFESNGDFSDESIGMQNFRVICKDMFYMQNRKNELENTLDAYKRELINYHIDIMKGIDTKSTITYVGDEKTEHMGK